MVGQVPQEDERIEFNDCVLSVAAMEGKRISKVLVTKRFSE
jgi:CBS domain containing-hemolysin-like protein